MEGCNPKNMGQIFDRLHTFLVNVTILMHQTSFLRRLSCSLFILLVSKVLNSMIK